MTTADLLALCDRALGLATAYDEARRAKRGFGDLRDEMDTFNAAAAPKMARALARLIGSGDPVVLAAIEQAIGDGAQSAQLGNARATTPARWSR